MSDKVIIKNGIEIPVELFNNHLDDLTNKVYKILCICEQCEANQDYDPYFDYTYKTAIILSGNKVLFSDTRFANIAATLLGLYEERIIEHSQVKKMVFECTNTLQKLKRPL